MNHPITIDQETLWREYSTLPPDAQHQVADFISFLAARYGATQNSAVKARLLDEPAVGMWRDREDMSDSNVWVRSTRTRECEHAIDDIVVAQVDDDEAWEAPVRVFQSGERQIP